jgi:hypothetical protein
MSEEARPTITVILGAGASRDVSYATDLPRSASDPGPSMPSPLDSDFFDLLQRLEARTEPGAAKDSMRRIIKQVVNSKGEPLWHSMEKMFYSLHVRAVLDYTLFHAAKGADSGHKLIEDFLASIRALLREAHGTRACENHQFLFQELYHPDAVLTFNYDFVAERTLAERFCARPFDGKTPFGDWFYGLGERSQNASNEILTLYKLHGSLNWSLEEDENGQTQNARKQWPGTWAQFAPELVYTRTDREEYRRDKHWRPPVLLPYWEKRVEKGLWLRLWKGAAEQLRRTDVLIIWGYSLPTTDLKARELLTLAFDRREAKLGKVVVIDPLEETRERWRRMFVRKIFFWFPSFAEFNQRWAGVGWRSLV